MERTSSVDLRSIGAVGETFLTAGNPSAPFPSPSTVMRAFLALLSWMATSWEVFLRRDFGERYFSWLRASLCGLLLVSYLSFFAMVQQSTPRTVVYAVFIWLVGAASLAQLARIWWRTMIERQLWHSMCFGVSWFTVIFQRLNLWALQQPMIRPIAEALPVDQWFLYRFIEPAIAIALSLPVLALDPVLGCWMLFAAMSLAVKNMFTYQEMRNQIMDLIDAQIEKVAVPAALAGWSQQHTAGISLVSVPSHLRRLLLDRQANPATPPNYSATLNQAFA